MFLLLSMLVFVHIFLPLLPSLLYPLILLPSYPILSFLPSFLPPLLPLSPKHLPLPIVPSYPTFSSLSLPLLSLLFHTTGDDTRCILRISTTRPSPLWRLWTHYIPDSAQRSSLLSRYMLVTGNGEIQQVRILFYYLQFYRYRDDITFVCICNLTRKLFHSQTLHLPWFSILSILSWFSSQFKTLEMSFLVE